MKPSVTGSEVSGEAAESDEEVVFHNTAPTSMFLLKIYRTVSTIMSSTISTYGLINGPLLVSIHRGRALNVGQNDSKLDNNMKH